jgi:glutamate-1-semialdehyde 2,1-aminomutase
VTSIQSASSSTWPPAHRGFDRSAKLLAEALKLTPGGVHSNVRLAEHPHPLFYERATGAEIADVDGNTLVDFVLGQGPMLLGHRPEPVLAAVRDQLDRGLMFAGQHRLELEAARLVVDLVPCAERVRFGLTGSEAVQAAVRMARAATGRQLVVKFQGHYDGWHDMVLHNVASPARAIGEHGELELVPESLGMAGSPGLVVLPWNDTAIAERVLRARGDDIAAVLLEPMMCNAGCLLPAGDYLERLRAACDAAGTVLIFDEVITGFRLARGGAQERFGVTPDLAVFGKAFAGGFPVSAVAGRADLFEGIATGAVNHSGTFNANPVGMAAVVASLRMLADDRLAVHARIEDRGTRLMAGIEEAGREAGLPVRVLGLPPVFTVVFDPVGGAVQGHADTRRFDFGALARLVPALARRGIRITARGTMFVSFAHEEAHVARAIESFRSAFAELGA